MTPPPPLRVSNRFKKLFAAKPPNKQAAILNCLKRLQENPRHPSLQARQMRGYAGVYEARVSGGDRLTYQFGVDGALEFRVNCSHNVLRNP